MTELALRHNEGKPPLSFMAGYHPKIQEYVLNNSFEKTNDRTNAENFMSILYLQNALGELDKTTQPTAIAQHHFFIVIGALQDNFTDLIVSTKLFSNLMHVFAFGATKYKRDNWKTGLKLGSLFDSALRHMEKILLGQENDVESGLPHAAHVTWNLLAALHFLLEMRTELNDL